MTSRLDSRQSRQRAALDQLSNSTDLRLDTILNLVNDELTMPLRLRASSTPDRKIYIGSIEIQTLDGAIGTGRRRTIQPISNLLPSFTAGYLELPSSSGGTITSDQGAGWFQSSYTLTVGSNQYIKIMIALSNQGKVVLTFGAPGASEAAATMPIALSGSLPIGYITAYNSSGIVQSLSDSNIRQFTSGGGGGGAGASSKQVTQAAHGFAPGDVLYLNGATYTKAQADTASTAEAVGIVSNVFASDLFELTEIGYISNASFTIDGGGTMTAGNVYFLSPSSPGKLTASEPSNVGYISKPMMIADGPTSGYVLNYRGSIVGGTNARSRVTLTNNNSTPVQYVVPYEAGEIVGWISLTNSTPSNSKKFYIQIQFAKNGPGTDYNIAYQVSGDTPPAGFAVSYSSDYIRITLPNISNLIVGSINYALNAPAVGTNFPLTVDGANVSAATINTQGTVSTIDQTFGGSKTFTKAVMQKTVYGKSQQLVTKAKTGLYRRGEQAVAQVSTWSSRTPAVTNSWQSVCWSPELGLFVAVGGGPGVGNRVMTSPDGVTWTTRTSPVDDNVWGSVCWSAELGLFVAVASTAVGTNNRVMTSPDGITWTLRTSPADIFWTSVCWSAELGLFVAVAASGTNRVATSPDGITWTLRTAAANNWYSVCWSPELGLFVAVATSGTGNRVMTSPDGVTWNTRTSSVDNNWQSVCWSPELGLFVAVASSGTGDRVMTSPDGVTWTTRTSPADNSWYSVCWSPELGLFVAVATGGTGGKIMTSPNGISWTTRNSSSDTINWPSVCWSAELGLFAAVSSTSGTNNKVMTSLSSGPTTTKIQSFAGNKTFNDLLSVGAEAITGTRLRSFATSTSELGLSVSRPTEAYALTNGAASLYSPSGTIMQLGPNGSSTGIAGGTLIDFVAKTTTDNATGAFIGVVSGSTTNGAANIVFGQRTGTSTWRENLRIAEGGAATFNSFQTADSTNAQFIIKNATGIDVQSEAGSGVTPGISGPLRVSKYTTTNRSINASGTINANGADYAEYMTKCGDFNLAKGDICGVDANGKLTNIYADSIAFVIKSTDPSYVGNDKWFIEPRPVDAEGNECDKNSEEYVEWLARMEEARSKVDRIAFSGQVPVNVLNATPGDYIVPVDNGGLIEGAAISNPSFEQYMAAIGKVIAIEEDGRARIIVKIA